MEPWISIFKEGIQLETYLLGITGASGSAYALRAAKALWELGAGLRIVSTDMGKRVLEYETGISLEQWAALHAGVILEQNDDLFSPIASGSVRCAGMAVVPCSMSTLGRLASGVTTDLLTRAADVMLKQKRPLVLVPRETPLSAIHLQNMLTLSSCGAFIAPAMPGFYNHPESVEDMVSFVAGKVLDCLGVENHLYRRWKEEE